MGQDLNRFNRYFLERSEAGYCHENLLFLTYVGASKRVVLKPGGNYGKMLIFVIDYGGAGRTGRAGFQVTSMQSCWQC